VFALFLWLDIFIAFDVGLKLLMKVLSRLYGGCFVVVLCVTSNIYADDESTMKDADQQFLEKFCTVLYTQLEHQKTGTRSIYRKTTWDIYQDCLEDIQRDLPREGLGRAVALTGIIDNGLLKPTLSNQYITYGFKKSMTSASGSLTFFHFKEMPGFEISENILDLLEAFSIHAKLQLISADGRTIIYGPSF
jgi:hypothetical protein